MFCLALPILSSNTMLHVPVIPVSVVGHARTPPGHVHAGDGGPAVQAGRVLLTTTSAKLTNSLKLYTLTPLHGS